MPDTRHGHIHWSELNTRDVERAKGFYTATLGWTCEPFPMAEAGEYTVCMMDGEPVAGIMDMRTEPAMEGLPEHWFTYIAVDDIDARVAGVAAAGGTIHREPFDVPSVGRIAIVQDAVGAVVGWITPASPE